jgi:pyruvate/2-oxoglutarate dehydrogenase complex dihydrolipoamide acyltransferase (E2) component
MPQPKPSYQIKPFPLSRRVIIDSGRKAKRKRTITALVEVDVTEARRIIHAHKEKTGEALSFTAFILACLGKAIDHNKYLHARRDIWGRLILFDDVDCTTMIEIELQEQKFPLAHIVRGINRRDVCSIHDEIRRVQTDPKSSEGLQGNTWALGAFLLLPAFIRDFFYTILLRSPQVFKQRVGTVMVTAVGMFGSGSGWGILPGSIYTTDVLIGGIAEKPGIVDGQIVRREFLSLTIGFDHDIVDGAPAARFVNRLKNLIESAYGLEDLQ